MNMKAELRSSTMVSGRQFATIIPLVENRITSCAGCLVSPRPMAFSAALNSDKDPVPECSGTSTAQEMK